MKISVTLNSNLTTARHAEMNLVHLNGSKAHGNRAANSAARVVNAHD